MRDVNSDLSEEKTRFEAEIALYAAKITAELEPEMAEYGEYEELSYFYHDAATMRDFEIRQFERIEDDGLPRIRYFPHEFVPNGRMMKANDEGQVTHIWDEPLVETLEKRFGVNRLMVELSTLGVDTNQLVRVGGGRGPGSRYYDSLDECSRAISRALFTNERYQHFTPLTEQQQKRLEFKAAQTAYAYWLEQKHAFEFATVTCEEGLFKGCTGLFGAPLDTDCKKAILSYLNSPSEDAWIPIRTMVVTGAGTLWQAWCAYDLYAQSFGEGGFPGPKTLIAALRSSVEQWAKDIEKNLAKTSPTGLRLVA